MSISNLATKNLTMFYEIWQIKYFLISWIIDIQRMYQMKPTGQYSTGWCFS